MPLIPKSHTVATGRGPGLYQVPKKKRKKAKPVPLTPAERVRIAKVQKAQNARRRALKQA